MTSFKPWTYLYKEQSDLATQVGYTATANFFPLKVKNKVAKIKSDATWSTNLLKNKKASDFSGLSLKCWSKTCPDFVKYDSGNFTIWTDFKTSNMRLKNGTYFYFIEYKDLVK